MVTTRFSSDIDIDIANRDQLLAQVPHTKASMWHSGSMRAHNSGFYPTPIPYDPIIGAAAIDYVEAEQRGYVKIDLLNMSVYDQVKSVTHLEQLMAMEPPWHKLQHKSFCEKVIHIGNWHSTIIQLPEPLDSIPRLMMFLAIIRPGKKHLIGKPWREIGQTVWNKADDGFSFKKAHACAYAHLVTVHMNLLNQKVKDVSPM